MKKIISLTLAVLGLMLLVSPSAQPQFSCVFPEEPNNIVRSGGGSITLVALNWEGDSQPVEEAIKEVIPLLEESPFLSWPPARGSGTVPVYPATEELIWCWNRNHKLQWGEFRSRTGPTGPGIYLLPNLDPLALRVTIAHETVHAFWTGNELIPRLVSVPIIVNYTMARIKGSP